MKITRKAMKQSGAALEQAVRRDMNGAIEEALDKAVFLGSGAAGQPTGIFAGASAWSITETAVDAAADWAAIRAEMVAFMTGDAATGPADVRMLMRPEIWDGMDGAYITGTAVTEWDRLIAAIGGVVMSNNALEAPTGAPLASSAILTTTAGGLRLTALATMDVTVSRSVQTRILTGLE